MRLENKIGIVVGAGQTPGDTIGNGRAAALLFAREGAKLLLVDRTLAAAEETAALIAKEGGTARCIASDWTRAADCRAYAQACLDAWGRIDFLHNNVGIGRGDNSITQLEEAVFDRILTTNLKAMWLTIKHVLPVMREQGGGGAIVNISSMAAVAASNLIAYGMSKAGVNKLTRATAAANTRYMIRCNCIMPGLMDTPMAVGGNAAARGAPIEEIRAGRDALVPLGRKMGTAWDVAYAALFLASDEAKFITGAILPVDGGMAAGVG